MGRKKLLAELSGLEFIDSQTSYTSWLPPDYKTKSISAFGRKAFEDIIHGTVEQNRDTIIKRLSTIDELCEAIHEQMATNNIDVSRAFFNITDKRVHELTAEDDLKIMRQLADGNSTLKTSIDMPCARSTVYNSIDRVNRFLKNETTDFDLLKCSCTMSNALIRGRWSHRSAQGMNLYIAFIALHQHGRNSMQREEALKHMPGLRNRKQQETILMELNNLTVLTDEEQPKNIKVFEFVEYKEHTYYFELTEDCRL